MVINLHLTLAVTHTLLSHMLGNVIMGRKIHVVLAIPEHRLITRIIMQ